MPSKTRVMVRGMCPSNTESLSEECAVGNNVMITGMCPSKRESGVGECAFKNSELRLGECAHHIQSHCSGNVPIKKSRG